MAEVPFYKIEIQDNQRDISNLVTSFTYDRDAEKDDMLKIILEFDRVDEVDDTDFIVGKKLVFKYGFVGGKVSKKRLVKIKSVIPTFDAKIKLTLVCHDLGTDLKRNTGQTIYKGKTTSDIATIVADSVGLGKNIISTSRVWTDMPQGNKSDFELLQYLADREENGDLIFFVSDNVLNLVKRDLLEESSITFTYGDGDGGVVSFKPKYKEAEADPAADSTTMTDFQTTADNSNTNEANTGEQMISWDQDANQVVTYDRSSFIIESGVPSTVAAPEPPIFTRSDFIQGDPPLVLTKKGREMLMPAWDKREADSHTKTVKKRATLKTLVATLEIELDPLLEVNKIITMKGVGQKFSGNWYIHGIKDGVKSTATTVLRLSKNSTKRTLRTNSDTNPKATVNKDIGPNTTGDTVDLVNFDQNGFEIPKIF